MIVHIIRFTNVSEATMRRAKLKFSLLCGPNVMTRWNVASQRSDWIPPPPRVFINPKACTHTFRNHCFQVLWIIPHCRCSRENSKARTHTHKLLCSSPIIDAVKRIPHIHTCFSSDSRRACLCMVTREEPPCLCRAAPPTSKLTCGVEADVEVYSSFVKVEQPVKPPSDCRRWEEALVQQPLSESRKTQMIINEATVCHVYQYWTYAKSRNVWCRLH